MATEHRLKKLKASIPQYPDDMFAETRMPLGDHIEELRYRMLAALKWLLFFLVIGFVLDGIGTSLGDNNIGVGKPMLKVITDPVETQARDFYYRRAEKIRVEKIAKITQSEPAEIAAIRERLERNGNSLDDLSADERRKLLGAPQELRIFLDTKQLEPAVGPLKEGTPKEIPLTLRVYPAEVNYLSDSGQALSESKQYLTTLIA